MESGPKPLYLATSLAELNVIVLTKERKTSNRLDQLCKAADRLFESSRLVEKDEELQYVYLRRYIIILEEILRQEQDPAFITARFRGSQSSALARIEELEKSLQERYENILPSTSASSSKKSETEVVEAKKPKTTAGIFPDQFVTIDEVIQQHWAKEKLIIWDCRTLEDHKMSKLKNIPQINIPESVIEEGLSAYKLGMKLPNASKYSYERRHEYKGIILMDWKSTKEDFQGSKLNIVLSILANWDTIILVNPPYILDGGFESVLEKYPTFTTNPNVHFDSQYVELDEFLDLESIDYPTFSELIEGEDVKRAIERTNAVISSEICTFKSILQYLKDYKSTKSEDSYQHILAFDTYLQDLEEERSMMVETLQKRDDVPVDLYTEIEMSVRDVILLKQKKENSMNELFQVRSFGNIEPRKGPLLPAIKPGTAVHAEDLRNSSSEEFIDPVEFSDAHAPLVEYPGPSAEVAGPSGYAASSGYAGPSGLEGTSGLADPPVYAEFSEVAGPSAEVVGPSSEGASGFTAGTSSSEASTSSGESGPAAGESGPSAGEPGTSGSGGKGPGKIPPINRSLKPIQRPHFDRRNKPPSFKMTPLNTLLENGAGGYHKGLTGLANIRNTCYQNTLIQCLRHIPLIAKYFLTRQYTQSRNNTLIRELGDVIVMLWKCGDKILRPIDLFQKLASIDQVYVLGTHEDIHQFLLIVLEALTQDTNYRIPRTENLTPSLEAWYQQLNWMRSYFTDNTFHQIQVKHFCPDCGVSSIRYDMENCLMLSVPPTHRFQPFVLEDLIESYVVGERYQTRIVCRKCRAFVELRRSFAIPPKIAIIGIKRYFNSGGKLEKIEAPCMFQEKMVMGNHIYRLYSIAMHQGNLEKGHYTAACLNPIDNRWYEFNDTTITSVNIQNDIIRKKAYLLFYEQYPHTTDIFM